MEHERDYGLGMDAKGPVCSWSTKEIGLGMDVKGIVCSWSLNLEHEGDYGLGMDVKGTVCSWNTNEIMVWAWMHGLPYALRARKRLWFGHGCKGNRMLVEHEGDYGLGMDALVTVCSWNMKEIMYETTPPNPPIPAAKSLQPHGL